MHGASLDTRHEQRDAHLRSPAFLDAARHPRITFQVTGVEGLGDSRFRVDGDLTIRGTKRSVVLGAEVVGAGVDAHGRDVVAIEARGAIDRRDFGMSFPRWQRARERRGPARARPVGRPHGVSPFGPPSHRLHLALKDVRLALDAGHDRGLELPLTDALARRWELAMPAHADDDLASVIDEDSAPDRARAA